MVSAHLFHCHILRLKQRASVAIDSVESEREETESEKKRGKRRKNILLVQVRLRTERTTHPKFDPAGVQTHDL